MPLFQYNSKILLDAYSRGLIPTLNANGEFILFRPERRAVLNADQLHISKTTQQLLRKEKFSIKVNQGFTEIVAACVRPTENWITPELIRVYSAINQQGWAHAVGCYDENGDLAGGLYGIAIGAVFFVESMFSRKTDASKLALIHLVERCAEYGFQFFDFQLMSDHLASMGVTEVSDDRFQLDLYQGLQKWTPWGFSIDELRSRVFPPQLATERLLIRGLKDNDADALYRMNTEREFNRFTMVAPPQTVDQAKEDIARIRREVYQLGTPDPLAICFKSNPERLIGTIGCFYPTPGIPQMELAYDVERSLWGQGIASEACRAMIDYCFLNYPVVRIQARCSRDHTASARVLEKIGFQHEGILKQVMYFAGKSWDMQYFAMIYSDWQQLRSGVEQHSTRRPEPVLRNQI